MTSVLKHLLIDYPGPAWRVAKKADLSDSKLSKIVNGYILPTEDEMNRLAQVLGKGREELFPEARFAKEE